MTPEEYQYIRYREYEERNKGSFFKSALKAGLIGAAVIGAGVIGIEVVNALDDGETKISVGGYDPNENDNLITDFSELPSILNFGVMTADQMDSIREDLKVGVQLHKTPTIYESQKDDLQNFVNSINYLPDYCAHPSTGNINIGTYSVNGSIVSAGTIQESTGNDVNLFLATQINSFPADNIGTNAIHEYTHATCNYSQWENLDTPIEHSENYDHPSVVALNGGVMTFEVDNGHDLGILGNHKGVTLFGRSFDFRGDETYPYSTIFMEMGTDMISMKAYEESRGDHLELSDFTSGYARPINDYYYRISNYYTGIGLNGPDINSLTDITGYSINQPNWLNVLADEITINYGGDRAKILDVLIEIPLNYPDFLFEQ